MMEIRDYLRLSPPGPPDTLPLRISGFPDMRFVRRLRITAVLAVVVLFCASTAFLAHGHDANGTPQNDVKCELCLQFGSATGAAAAPAVVVGLALVVLLAACPAALLFATAERPRAHPPRAPPARV
jgi:hypothetical protein